MKKVLMVLLVAMGVIVMGCESTTPEKVDKDDGQQEVTIKPEVEKFTIGDAVKMDDLEFTVNSARWEGGDEFDAPKAGQKWLALDCTILNTGNESVAISSMLNFALFDEDSYSRDLEIFANQKGSLDGELLPGDKLRGEIAFNIDEGQSIWKFAFKPEVFGSGKVYFEINKSEVK